MQSLNYEKPVLGFTHGGFIFNLLSSKGQKKMINPGSVVSIIYHNNFDKENKKNKIFFSYYNEFSKVYNCQDENYNESFFEKYNTIFEEYLKENIEKIECIYDVPDLSEEMF